MFVVRVYSILNSLVTEVSCVGHGTQGEPAGHMVARVTTFFYPLLPEDVLGVVAEELAGIARQVNEGVLEMSDDCWP